MTLPAELNQARCPGSRVPRIMDMWYQKVSTHIHHASNSFFQVQLQRLDYPGDMTVLARPENATLEEGE